MIEPLQIVWIASIIIMFMTLVVLFEVHRINFRRENEVMFGTKAFDDKVEAMGFTDKEKRTLDKIIRYSSFENKDAVLNSSRLFEDAVDNFYDIRNVFSVRDETLAAVESLRKKLSFTASNPLAEIYSTRQFNVGDRIDLLLENGLRIKRSEIMARSEKEWVITFDTSDGTSFSLVNKEIKVRWTRPDDAIYTAVLPVRQVDAGHLVLLHSSSLDKKQLRRWVREQVAFPVTAVFQDGSSIGGTLLDLSAGGIMVGLPKECYPGQHMRIQFELPSFGDEDVEIEILRNLGHKNQDYPHYYCHTASFKGAFGWTQERVLQYLFEINKRKKQGVKWVKST
ncbi:PilZ domain-containing protein [Fibrobacter sp.]|uniref:PilZ domain-containing protein n=1 Tax=Fibrobacter sp. TaxID=35828 RepID=UPI00388F17B2